MNNDIFVCPTCGVQFSARHELDRHNRDAHARASNTKVGLSQQAIGGVHCPECGAEFTTADQLHRHRKREHQAST
ncbi:MAG TPA: C2H2-type zinc finger protein [Ktedonobacterales bacterium]